MHAFSHVKRVAVIGGGVAGLNTARALTARGISVVLFEKEAEVGGVWRSNYSGYGLQVPANLYSFLDFPMTSVSPWDYPTGAQVQSYIKDFRRQFVDSKVDVRLNSKVESLEPLPGDRRGWTVNTCTGGKEQVDFAVFCTGLYSTPFIPNIERDEGARLPAVVHSSHYTSAAETRGKHVVVLGGCKSGLDCAVAASDAGAASTTILMRNAHYGTPRKIAGLIPFQ
jgi:dimethylaniline monooxygenase (N-oxide forming)